MIALDTNLLVYAHRARTPESRAARRAIEVACNDTRGCGIAGPSLGEFWSIVTHRDSVGGPSSPLEACEFLQNLQEDGGVQIWLPVLDFGTRLFQLASDLGVLGARIFDLQIALTAFENGATELWTHDAGFVRLPGLRYRDPISSHPKL